MSRWGRVAEASTARTATADASTVQSDGLTRPLRGDPRPLVGFAPGARAGRYEIVGRLGAGSMGIVYEARDAELHRTVALKLVRTRAHDGQRAQTRLHQEAQAMARLSHPNVASVFDIGVVDDQLFIAMELVRGHTLRDVVATDRPWRDKLALALAAGRGLTAAHQAGIVHRDFKPDNVLVGSDGSVRVTDFGLALAADDPGEPATAELATHSALMGTPAYMAPESVHGTADALADQYALAITMYELLEGQRPFPGRASPAALRASLAGQPRPWQRRDIPAAVRTAIERGFAADPAARWPSVAALCAAVERGAHRRRSTSGIAILSAGIVIVAGIAAMTRFSAPARAIVSPTSTVPGLPTFATAPQQQITFSGEASNPVLSGDSRLAYSLGRGQRTIILQDLETGAMSRISDDASLTFWFARWSPDGTKLVIGSPEGASAVSAAGKTLQRFAWASSANWSADGSQLASTFFPAPALLTLTDARTKAVINQPLVLPGAIWPSVFDWSMPDRILIFATMTAHRHAVWSVRPNGSNPRKIYEDTRSSAVDLYSWIARGRSIYYQRKRDQTTEIVQISLDDTDHVTGEHVVFSTPTFGGGFTISDDERSLIYARVEESSTVAMFSGGQRTALTSDTLKKASLRVSPDGRTIAFIAGVGERARIVMIPREGGAENLLPMVEGSPRELAWSPHGDRLAYTVVTVSGMQLWTVELATGSAQRVETSTLSSSGDIAWTARDELLFQLEGNNNYGVLAPGKPQHLLLQTGERGWMFRATPSRDGRRVAVLWNRPSPGSSGVWVISLDDGAATQIYSDSMSPVAWTADDTGLLVENMKLYPSGPLLEVDASGTGSSRLALSPPHHSLGSLHMLKGDEGFITIESAWRSDLWLVSLDGRRIAASALPPPEAHAVVQPALRNGAMAHGAVGATPASWRSSTVGGATVMLVDGCGGQDGHCAALGPGGSLDQWIDATGYRGHRIRLRARGRTDSTARLLIFVETSSGPQRVARYELSSTRWTDIDLHADIRADAVAVLVRLAADPDSHAWFDDVSLERVGR